MEGNGREATARSRKGGRIKMTLRLRGPFFSFPIFALLQGSQVSIWLPRNPRVSKLETIFVQLSSTLKLEDKNHAFSLELQDGGPNCSLLWQREAYRIPCRAKQSLLHSGHQASLRLCCQQLLSGEGRFWWHLNLSCSSFSGQVASQISGLSYLISLVLERNPRLSLPPNPGLGGVVRNLT